MNEYENLEKKFEKKFLVRENQKFFPLHDGAFHFLMRLLFYILRIKLCIFFSQMLWQCEKSLAEILFDSVLRWWYPGVWPIQVSRGTRATVTTPYFILPDFPIWNNLLDFNKNVTEPESRVPIFYGFHFGLDNAAIKLVPFWT